MPYARIEGRLAEERCVILDGGVATEIQRLRPLRGSGERPDPDLWGTWALTRAPAAVREVHRRYAAAGCDVVSTNTWSILSASEVEADWLDTARVGIALAREGIADAAREDAPAVAFSLAVEPPSLASAERLALLGRALADDPPDLLLVETMSLIRGEDTFALVERLVGLGLPVWLSFRRCRQGVCGVYGQHWGPPEGDLFGRAARRFEEMGVRALLVNCLPPGHVPGMLPWLRDFTDLPLGVYPNLGRLAGSLWAFDERVGPAEYAALALDWREEGAQVVGGCCGVTPEHLTAAAEALEGTARGTGRPTGHPRLPDDSARPEGSRWLDESGRSLFPLPFPELLVEEGVFVPTHGSFLAWKHLFRTGLGRGLRCLDVGSGTGILAVQLALNGAVSVHAVDVERRAVAATLANAHRNGVAERVTAAEVDLYEWEPEKRYDLVVASLYQMPVDPYAEPAGHRPLDYWGRNLLDHLLGLLPDLVEAGGSALVMQLSIVGQEETARILAERALEARVVDFSFFPFGPQFEENRAQIRRVEEQSDAYHLRLAEDDVMVAYLLEIRPGGA